ncbi:MAG: site-2 protease family protein [Clostridia bacterium]|nr:site-2 protease family protein [Clostridia bacterium]
MQFLYIVIAILMFGFLITIHEFGHFLFARIFHVNVIEFSIGMGPKLFQRTSKKSGILYTLRLLPIGGYVNMGEDDPPEEGIGPDPGAFRSKPVWQRFIIVSAGAIMNIALGFVLMFGLVLASDDLGSTTVREFAEGAVSCEQGLMIGDTIVKVNDVNVHSVDELRYEIMYNGHEPLDITVMRNGERIVLDDVAFYVVERDGVKLGVTDFGVDRAQKTIPVVLRQAFHRSVSAIKMVWDSLIGLITGRFGVENMSGPVGITSAITHAASIGLDSLVFLFIVITMNLGVFNLLPVPALDGGRLLFFLIEFLRGKPIDPKYESYVHFAGLCVLLLIMVLVSVKDIISLIF